MRRVYDVAASALTQVNCSWQARLRLRSRWARQGNGLHELSLAESAIELIESVARKERFKRVRVVHLEVGALSCVEPAALAFAFQSASLGTCAEGAQLNVLHVPGEGLCPACGTVSVMDTLLMPRVRMPP